MASPENSLLIRSATAITDTNLPVLRRHPMINNGSLACYRFNRPDCIDMSGGLADGMVVNDLAGKVSGRLVLPDGNNLVPWHGNAGIELVGGLGRIRLEEGGDLFQGNPLDHDLLIMAWARWPDTSNATGPGAGGLFGREIAYENLSPPGPFFVHQYPTTPGGNDAFIAAKFASDSSNGTVDGGNVSPAGLHHVAMLRSESLNKVIIYKDGVTISAQDIAGPLDANAAPMVFGQTLSHWAPDGLVLHSWYAEDITISGAGVDERIATDGATGADFA